MLTDIFARRYQEVPLWHDFTDQHRRLLVQCFQLVEQIAPYYQDGKASDHGKAFWTTAHDLMARELGVNHLSPLVMGFYNPQKQWVSHTYSMYHICENWMLQTFDFEFGAADTFLKERFSFVEIAFRNKERTITEAIETFKNFSPTTRRIRDHDEFLKKFYEEMNEKFRSAVNELNARFRQAGCNLHYHNGFIQIATDEVVTEKIETPVWALLSDAKWKNVDHDLKEAFDLRDADGRDPAFYAARALESTIKIISDEQSLTTGNERGASNNIDNLRRGKIIDGWEADALKAFFSHVRNPLGHGPGSGDMPSLAPHQTNWAIETGMIWIKSLILRR